MLVPKRTHRGSRVLYKDSSPVTPPGPLLPLAVQQGLKIFQSLGEV